MANMDECLNILRRRVGDTEQPFTFTDELLIGYLEDAVIKVEIDFPRGIKTEFGLFPLDITQTDAMLFAIKAHYLVKLRTKDKADRDNFRLVKGRLTLDSTNQAQDHAETLKYIELEYKRTLLLVRNGGSTLQGVRME